MRLHTGGRKAALTILAALALIGAAACGDDDDSTGSGGTTETTAATADTTAAPATDAPSATTAAAADTTAAPATDAPSATTAATPDTTAAPAAGGLGEPNAATDTPITIGFVTDGENAAFGSDKNRVATVEATVQYANEYLGGVNGHPLELKHCSTDATPAGGTQCGVELAGAGVAAALVPASAQDGAIYDGLTGSGIPYFTYTSATGPIIGGPGAYVMSNPISAIAAPGLIAKEQGIDKVGFVIIDVPAAVGPITAIAQPIYASLGIELQIIPIAPSVADMTPQLQEAISGGAGFFSITGTDDFVINGVNGLRQLGFEGPINVAAPSQAVRDGVSSFDGLVGLGTQTSDPSDVDVALMHTIVETYSDIDPEDADVNGFAAALGFVRALTGATDAVDAATVTAALSAMPETDMPLGAGITFQCGTTPVSFAPNICSLNVLQWTFNNDGEQQDISVVEVPADVLKLG